MVRFRLWSAVIVVFALGWACAMISLQSACAQPPQVPSFPPINPGQAHFDHALGGLDGPGLALAANDASGIVAAACEHGTIHYWTRSEILGIRTGEATPNVLSVPGASPMALAWGSGPLLASAWTNQSVVLWSMPEGLIAHQFPAGTYLRALAMSPDGMIVAGAGDDTIVHIWSTQDGTEAARLPGHTDWVNALAFSQDGKWLASGGADGVVKVWDVAGKKKHVEFSAQLPLQPNTPPLLNNAVTALAFGPDGKTLAVGGSEGFILLTNPADGKLIRSMQLQGQGHTAGISSLVFHPSGSVLVSGSKDRTVRIWAPENGQPQKVLEGHGSWVQGVCFLERGTRIASVGADQTVRLWDISQPR